jgi:hypothetical protein
MEVRMASIHKVTTTDLTIKFWEKSFAINGIGKQVFMDRVSFPGDRQKIADTMQEIYDKGRGRRPDDKLSKSVPISDVKKVANAEPKEDFHKEVGEAMEIILERLDSTYGREDLTEEKQYYIRVGILTGVISDALNRGRTRGLDEATDRLKKTIWGTD